MITATTTKTCPHCGAPITNERECGWGTWKVYSCGYEVDDGPGKPCRNRDERANRDESTKPQHDDLTLDELEEELGETGMAARFAQIPSTLDDPKGEPVNAPYAYPDVSTLPAIKPKVVAVLSRLNLAVEVVERLKGYGKLVLADVTDKKAAADFDEKRKEVKRARNAWENACKNGRADANAEADAWVKAQKALAEPFKEVEEHLDAEFERHQAWKREEARKIEEARLERIRVRVEAVVAIGAPLDMAQVETLNDEDWTAYLADLAESKRLLDAATAIAEELTAMGDPCTAAEALQLEDEQAAHRLAVARKADHDRRETARIKAEEEAEAKRKAEASAQAERERIAAEERAARERLERGAQRMRELALLGSVEELEILADMTDEAWNVALETARQDKAGRDQRAAEERQRQAVRDAEAAALRQQEADRLRREAEALEQRKREAKEAAEKAEREAKASREQAEREEQERQARERAEALRPEREKIAAWARAVLDAIPSTPEIQDSALLRRMSNAVEGAREILLDLENEMGAATVGAIPTTTTQPTIH